MSLRCGHSFCKTCISAIWAAGKIKCPIDCKSQSYKSAEAVGKNYSLISMLEKDSRNSPSDFCEQHKKERLLFYCLDDKSLICQQCLLGKHLNHKIEESKAYLLGKQVLSHVT